MYPGRQRRLKMAQDGQQQHESHYKAPGFAPAANRIPLSDFKLVSNEEEIDPRP